MESVLTQVGIVGAGELGHALGDALTRAHIQILYYDKDTTKTTTPSIEDLVRSCEVLLLCVPSWEVKGVAHQLSKAAHPHQPRLVITMAKGVEPGFVTMDKVLRERLPEHYDIGVLYGPMIADELELGRMGSGVLALSKSPWFNVLREHFAQAKVYLEMSGDIRGVALCAALKNIYAIGFGLIDGLNCGLNAKGKMAVMVLAEMKRILGDLKADPLTAEGLAGLGDILATGFGDASFNYRVGKSLAERIANEHIKSEGLVALYELGKHTNLKRYPIANAIDNIVFHYAKPQTLVDLLTS